MITIWKVRALLVDRSITPDEENDFLLQDNSDGVGPFIAHWDEAKLGPIPSEADLDLFQAEAVLLQKEAARNPDAELRAVLAKATTIAALKIAFTDWLAMKGV